MNIALNRADGHLVVALRGRFVFECHRDFRSVVERSLKDASSEVQFDLTGVDYLDSAALGMLQILRDKAEAAGKRVVLCNSRREVGALLDMAGIASQLS